MYKIIKKADAQVRKIAENKIAINYVTKELSPQVSFAVTEATDYTERETAAYTRIYYVLEGTMTLEFETETVTVGAGDVCFVEKGTSYVMRGTFKATMVNQPAFGT